MSNNTIFSVDELPLYEQPSLSLDEMEKAWNAEEHDLAQCMRRGCIVTNTGVYTINADETVGAALFTDKKRVQMPLNTGFFYCPYIPKLNSPPKKRRVLSSR